MATLETMPAQVPAEAELLIRSETRLVEVNVVVQGRDGRPVRDLTREDFTIKEDGKPQKISIFALPAASAPVKLPANAFSNVLGPDTDTAQSVTAILLDGINTDLSAQLSVRRHVLSYLKTARANERIALFSLTHNVRVLHDFTLNVADLIERVKNYRGESTSLLEGSTEVFEDPQGARISDASVRRGMPDVIPPPSPSEQLGLAEIRTRATLNGLEVIGRHLAGLPGRKTLIWMSSSFPTVARFGSSGNLPKELRVFGDDINRTVRLLNNANVAVYPVDARGLMDIPAAQNRRVGLNNLHTGVDTMLQLANLTGGRAFYNRNDLDVAIKTAVDDSAYVYTLGYYTTRPEADDRFRRIDVDVNQSGVSVRHRGGYLASRQKPVAADGAKQGLVKAILEPMDTTKIKLLCKVDPAAGSDALRVLLNIDLKGLALAHQADRWTGSLQVVLAVIDAKGRPADESNETLKLDLKKDTYVQVLQNGLTYSKTIPRRPDVTHLKIGVMDMLTQETGTLTIPLARLVASGTPPAR